MFYRILYSYVCFMNFAFSSIFKKLYYKRSRYLTYVALSLQKLKGNCTL